MSGPQVFKEPAKERAADNEEGDDEDDKSIDGEENFDPEKLRQYELDKLRYFYAVIECDSKETAKHIFDEVCASLLDYGANCRLTPAILSATDSNLKRVQILLICVSSQMVGRSPLAKEKAIAILLCVHLIDSTFSVVCS